MSIVRRPWGPLGIPEQAATHLALLQAACLAAYRAKLEKDYDSAFGADAVVGDLLEYLGAYPPYLTSSRSSTYLNVNPEAFRPVPVEDERTRAFYLAGLATQETKLRRLADHP